MWKKNLTRCSVVILVSTGTGFSWLLSFLLTTALTGAKNKRARGQTRLFFCYFQSYGDIMWVTFCISSLIHLNEKALRVFDAVPWFEVNKALRATLLHKKRLKMQSPKGVTQMSTSHIPSVKIWVRFLGRCAAVSTAGECGIHIRVDAIHVTIQPK